MKIILLLIFLSGSYELDALHIHNSYVTVDTAQENKSIPVLLVMFDQSFMNLSDCWFRYYAQNISKKYVNLDVVVFDESSAKHTREYLKREYPHILRRLQVVTPPIALLQSGKSNTSTKWPSMPYQAFYWQLIQERLEQGEDVWHMDIDTLITGDAWTLVDHYLTENMDIVAPGVPYDVQQEIVYYRNTKAVKTIVDHFAGIWKTWLKNASTTSKQPVPAERVAMKNYLQKYNPDGCDQKEHYRICKTDTGSHFNWGHQLPTYHHAGLCRYPDGCEELGMNVVHGHSMLAQYCTPEEYGSIFQDTNDP